MPNPSQVRLKELLLQLSYEQREVTLSSGQKSNFYFDGRQTTLNPEGASLIGELLFEKIRQNFPDVQGVGGPTLGADPLVTAVSVISFQKKRPLPGFIIRKEPKKHGTALWIEGFKNFKPGMKVVILEDVVTTGKSSLIACERATEAGLAVRAVLTLVDREEGGRGAIENAGLQFDSLFTKTELVG